MPIRADLRAVMVRKRFFQHEKDQEDRDGRVSKETHNSHRGRAWNWTPAMLVRHEVHDGVLGDTTRR